ncbi:MAG TPA: acyl-homoserine-lactone synthase [Hyphomicrobiaceae bacterium]|nr:acyl-homoserine-lactone synthase [Hyphomicrobiaceae bacterium]
MIVAFNGGDELHYPHLFHQMYRQRHEIYVVRRKWRALKSVGGLERDQFDTPAATYLLALDRTSNVLAGLRLLPTEGPHLLADVYPHLAHGEPIPRGSDTFELTRFYVSAAVRGPPARRLVGLLAAGLFEHCLQRRVRRLTSVVDTFLVPRMESLGWRVRTLGAPGRYDEGIAVGVEIAVTPSALEEVRRRRGIERGVLHKRAAPEEARKMGPG